MFSIAYPLFILDKASFYMVFLIYLTNYDKFFILTFFHSFQMRKKRKDIKKEKQKIFLSIFSIIVLVGSRAGVGLYSTSSDQEDSFQITIGEEDYKFSREFDQYGNVFYNMILDKETVKVYNLPDQVENLEVSDAIIKKIVNSNFIYFTFEPDQEDISFIEFIRYDMANDFAGFNKFMSPGITTESTAYQFPIVTCENSSIYAPVMEFITSNTTEIIEANNCIQIKTRRTGFIKFRDKVLYNMHGLII